MSLVPNLGQEDKVGLMMVGNRGFSADARLGFSEGQLESLWLEKSKRNVLLESNSMLCFMVKRTKLGDFQRMKIFIITINAGAYAGSSYKHNNSWIAMSGSGSYFSKNSNSDYYVSKCGIIGARFSLWNGREGSRLGISRDHGI